MSIQRLHAFMYDRYSSGQILPSFAPVIWYQKPGLLNHAAKLFLTRKSLYALDQILITISVGGNQLPDQRNGAEAPTLVDRIQERIAHFSKLQARKHTARFEHTKGFPQRAVLVGEVPNAKGNGVEIDAVRGHTIRPEIFGIGFEPIESVLLCSERGRRGALAAFSQHVWIDVGDGHSGRRIVVDCGRVLEHAEGDVARPAGDVEYRLWSCGGAWVQRADEVVFP